MYKIIILNFILAINFMEAFAELLSKYANEIKTLQTVMQKYKEENKQNKTNETTSSI